MGQKCPQCNTEAIIEGKIYNLIDYVNPPAYFRPTKAPFYAIFNTNVNLQNKFFACSFCGFIWAKLDTQSLQQILRNTKAV